MGHVAGGLAKALTVVLFALCSGGVLAAPQVGWWWNPDESGRGFFIESQGGIIYLAGYFYDATGRPTWLVAGGPNSDPYSFDGRLQSYAGGQTLFGAYTPPSGPNDAGPISLRFTDDTHATLTWAGGTIALQRHAFGGDESAFKPLPGWWWNPAESGRGYSVELQGDTLFVASFMYDDAGSPAWYISAGPMSSPTHYEGTWRRYANGQTMTGPYRAPDTPQTVGTLTVDFIQADKATMTFTPPPAIAGAPVPKASAAVTVPVVREFQPKYELAEAYTVRFNYKAMYKSAQADIIYTVSGAIPFKRVSDDLAPLFVTLDPPGTAYLHAIDPGARTYSIQYHATLTAPFPCTFFGQASTPVPVDGGNFRLEISEFGPYDGRILIPKVAFDVGGTCQANGFQLPVNDKDEGLIVDIPMSGSIVSPTGSSYKGYGVGVTHTFSWALVR